MEDQSIFVELVQVDTVAVVAEQVDIAVGKTVVGVDIDSGVELVADMVVVEVDKVEVAFAVEQVVMLEQIFL